MSLLKNKTVIAAIVSLLLGALSAWVGFNVQEQVCAPQVAAPAAFPAAPTK